MAQSSIEPPAPARGLCHVMAAGRSKDRSGRPLSATAINLYWALCELGGVGEYPGTAPMSLLINAARNSTWRAERALMEAGLVEFAQDAGGAKSYRLKFADMPLASQQRGVEEIFGGPVAVAQEPPPPRQRQTKRRPKAQPPPDAPQAAPAAEAKPRQPRLTDDAKAWFIASPENMDLYLRFGAAACGKTPAECEGVLPPGGTDWLAFKPAPRSDTDLLFPFDPRWKPTHHMGYFWHGVCRWRAAHGLELLFPQWDRLAGEVKKALATSTSFNVFSRVYTIIHHFDLIRWRIGRIGEDLTLNEIALNHKLVVEHAMLMASKVSEPGWVEEQYERMKNNQTPEGE